MYLNQSIDFKDYIPRKDGKSIKELYSFIRKVNKC